MSKKKKKYFQGQAYVPQAVAPASQNIREPQGENLDEFRYLKKDIVKVLFTLSGFITLLVILFIIDLKYHFFSQLATQITAIFIK